MTWPEVIPDLWPLYSLTFFPYLQNEKMNGHYQSHQNKNNEEKMVISIIGLLYRPFFLSVTVTVCTRFPPLFCATHLKSVWKSASVMESKINCTSTDLLLFSTNCLRGNIIIYIVRQRGRSAQKEKATDWRMI